MKQQQQDASNTNNNNNNNNNNNYNNNDVDNDDDDPRPSSLRASQIKRPENKTRPRRTQPDLDTDRHTDLTTPTKREGFLSESTRNVHTSTREIRPTGKTTRQGTTTTEKEEHTIKQPGQKHRQNK